MIGQSTSDTPALRKDAIGLREVLFQSITDMAPGAAIAASIPAGAAFAGGSLPLAVVFALIAACSARSRIAELAGRIPAAGSLATYVARGLHKSLGLPDRLVLRPGRHPHLAARAAAARLHRRRHVPQFLALVARPLVGLHADRRADRHARRALRHPDVSRPRHHPRHLRDRRVRGPRRHADRARRLVQHAVGLRHRAHAGAITPASPASSPARSTRPSRCSASRAPRRWPRRPATRDGRSARRCCSPR